MITWRRTFEGRTDDFLGNEGDEIIGRIFREKNGSHAGLWHWVATGSQPSPSSSIGLIGEGRVRSRPEAAYAVIKAWEQWRAAGKPGLAEPS